MFGVNYTHRLVLKAGLYVYEQFLEDETIENPAGDILLFKPVFVAPEHVVSHYSVRLNKTARLVFELKKDHMIFLVAVGSHDVAYCPS